jgi:hypothetical protein
VVCLKDTKLFRMTMGKVPHVSVFPAFNPFGHGPPLFVLLPRFASAQGRFAVYHRGTLDITQSPSGRVSGPALREFAEWFWEGVGAYRAEGGWPAEGAVFVSGQAPSPRMPNLCESQ